MKTLSSLAINLSVIAALAGCTTPPATPPASASPALLAAWIERGELTLVRAVATPGGCPELRVDGQPRAMSLRVSAGTPAQRPTANGPAGPEKPSAFPVDTCEAALAAHARSVQVAGHALQPPPDQARRIVVLGDTGCRIKGAASQACADPNGWPFAQVAATAAALRPDLVIHVGDYHYRETPCPSGNAGCAGSPWGYGWDAWNADFFVPARALLDAAPWVFVRGNHEECNRAGQGWFRFLDPAPWSPARSCDRPEDDARGDFSAPYAVPLDATTQLIVFDSAHAGNSKLDLARPGDRAIHDAYVDQACALDALARPGVRSWFTSHHPVLGFASDDRPGATRPFPGNPPLLQALSEVNGNVYFPPGVQLALHGHVHLFQALGFADGHPATLVAGNGGDNLDSALPAPLPADASPAPGTRLAHATTSDAFGFLLLERLGDADEGRWRVTAYRRDGSAMTHCQLEPTGALACEREGAVR